MGIPVSSPTDSPTSDNLEDTQQKLREGIEAGRHIVRQSRLLIELLASDRVRAANDNDAERQG